jgi:ribosomal protein S18 acetylase RimI-like enzyme
MDIRPATSTDLPDIVRMLADDPLGAQRERFEDPLPPAYSDAFDAIVRQHGNQILVAVEPGAGGNDLVIGCLQLTFIPGLARLGTTRAQIDGVRVDARHRGKNIGESLTRAAINLAREAGCGLVQLTTDKSRRDAHRFYERLGFVASHEGMKLAI